MDMFKQDWQQITKYCNKPLDSCKSQARLLNLFSNEYTEEQNLQLRDLITEFKKDWKRIATKM